MKTQGTQLYLIDPDDSSVIRIPCVTSITGIDTTIEQNDVTCLEDSTRRLEAGLGTPGAASFGIYTDLQDEVHVRLHELKRAGTQLQWAVGLSDGVDIDPTVTTDSNGDDIFDLPEERSWITFEGFMNAFSFEFQQNAAVQSTIGIQVSGDPIPVGRSAS